MAIRLPFKLAEWAPRITWVSAEAREVWQPRIAAVSQAWIHTERDLVAAWERPSTLQHVSPEQLPSLIQSEAQRGLHVLPLAQVAKVSNYQSATVALTPNAPFDYKVAITCSENAAAWAEAWSTSNNNAIGRLLGYPECCRVFFQKNWVKEKWFDTTWPMFINGEHHDIVNNPTSVNILWRWHGVRSVSHLPCSFSCQPSITQGVSALKVMAVNHPQEAEWLEEILSWPVEWTALHGIAEIRTPIHRTSVATDATAEKLTVRYEGTRYPAEGAKGLTFPHRTVASETVLPFVRIPTTNPSDNGFNSMKAMYYAHEVLLEALGHRTFETVLDLGCGDGSLARRVLARRRVGIEADPLRAKRAQARLDRVIVGNCSDPELLAKVLAEETPDLIIAQRHRNPPNTLNLFRVLSYDYDTDEPEVTLIEPLTLISVY